MTQKPTRQTVCGAIAALLLSSCATGPRVIVSKFPSPDFRLVVEELADVDGVVQVQRRFRVLADGTCSYARASAQLVDPETGITLPVFSILSVYQLMGINVRLLARKLHKQQLGVLTQAEIGGVLDQSRRWRISYRAANTQSELVVGGQINRLLVGIFNVINNHVPPGEGFALQACPAIQTRCPTATSRRRLQVCKAPLVLTQACCLHGLQRRICCSKHLRSLARPKIASLPQSCWHVLARYRRLQRRCRECPPLPLRACRGCCARLSCGAKSARLKRSTAVADKPATAVLR